MTIKMNNKIFEVLEKHKYLLFVNFPDQLIPLLKEKIELYNLYNVWCIKPDILHPIQQECFYDNFHEWKYLTKEFNYFVGIEERYILITNSSRVLKSFITADLDGSGVVMSFYNDYKYRLFKIKDLKEKDVEGLLKTTSHQLQYYLQTGKE